MTGMARNEFPLNQLTIQQTIYIVNWRSFRRRLPSLLDRWFGLFRRWRQGAIAFPVEHKFVCAVAQAVQGGRADHLVRGKGRTPFVKMEVRRQDRGRSLVALNYQIVEVLVLGRTERFQPKVIDDEQRHLAELNLPDACASGCDGIDTSRTSVWSRLLQAKCRGV